MTDEIDRSTTRMDAFSDGLFAIGITLSAIYARPNSTPMRPIVEV